MLYAFINTIETSLVNTDFNEFLTAVAAGEAIGAKRELRIVHKTAVSGGLLQ
jgi:hypothetical protein